nr:putative homeodomain transcription factor [Drosophila virilis]
MHISNKFSFCLRILLFVVLYITHLINWAINVHHAQQSPGAAGLRSGNEYNDDKQHSEKSADLLNALLMPCVLSLLISLIHSQIVATNTLPSGSNKNNLRLFSLCAFGEKPNAPREQRLRRRKSLYAAPFGINAMRRRFRCLYLR